MSKIIIVNRGSASKKYALFEDNKLLMDFHFEKNFDGFILHQKKDNAFNKSIKISEENYNQAFEFCIDLLLKDSYVNYDSDIDSVVFRIVAPGKYFSVDRKIDDFFLSKLDEIREHAPMHIDKMHLEFNQVLDRLPDVKLLGISDSRFHNTIPQKAKIYALPFKVAEQYELYRYGYHGISVSSVIKKINNKIGIFPEKTIVCHLGGGSSITALLKGESVDNSMGYSPLEGVTMATRIGNVDSGALFSLADQADLEISEIRDLLYNSSGILGISGLSDDIRELIKESEKGNQRSSLALENFVYTIKKQIGSMAATLNGLDALIFTGTIGERSNYIREKVCHNLEYLGLSIDENTNRKLPISGGYINKFDSKVSVEVVNTQESQEMADRAIELV